jgi:phosphate transport system protein
MQLEERTLSRAIFDRELDRLRSDVLSLGSLVAENVNKVVDALLKRNRIVAQRLIDDDRLINERSIGIILDSLTLIATQQPMAGDMRLIAAMVEIAGELERMHDYVKGIARTSLELGDDQTLPELYNVELPPMAALTVEMLQNAMNAFSQRDAVLARAVPVTDEKVDAIFLDLYKEVVHFAATSPDNIQRANQLEWVIHNLERTADRITNICEWVLYMVTGEYVEFDTEYEAPPAIGD